MATNIIDQNYLNDLKQLIIGFDVLDNRIIKKNRNENLLNNLKDNYNKIFMYDMYQDKQLIAVTGLQGAGKTMLVKELFQLPDELFPENNSRGERLPIFISEGDVSKPILSKYVAIQEDKEEIHKVVKEELTSEEFKKYAMNPDEDKDLWLECVVPPKLLRDERKVIVLLPGYEKSKKDFSQKLLDFIVHMSNFSIMVLNKNTYARKTSNSLLKKIEKKFEGLSPIVALTHGDETPEQNESIRNSVIEDMNIENSDRVIVTGRSKIIGDQWKQDMVKSMENLWQSKVVSDDENESFVSMIEEIDDNIEDLIDLYMEAKEEESMKKTLGLSKSSPVNQFKKAYTSYLDRLEESLINEMNLITLSQNDVYDIVKKHTGFLSSLKKLFSNNELKDYLRFQDSMMELWGSDKVQAVNKTLTASKRLMYENIGQLNVTEDIKQLGNSEERSYMQLKNINDTDRNNSSLIETDNSFNELDIKFSQANSEMLDKSITNINQYFLQNAKGKDTLTSLNDNDYNVLVFMGAQFLNNGVAGISESKARKLMELGEDELSNIHLNLGNHALKGEQSLSVLRKAMIAVPVVLGLDVAIDGEADILQNVLLSPIEKTAEISVGAFSVSAATLSTITYGLIGAGSVAFIASQVMKDVNQTSLELFKRGTTLVDLLKEAQVKSQVENQRAIFQKMEDKLIRTESYLSGESSLVGQLELSIYQANRILLKNREVKKDSYKRSLLF